MDGVSLYRESYVAHCARPARTCRPPPLQPVKARFSETTEQRDNFDGEVVDVCPAVQLLQRVPGCVVPADLEVPVRRWNRGIGRFRYSDRDESGHEWYTFEECHLPGPERIVYDPHRYVRGDSVEAAAARVAASRAMKWAPPRYTAIPAVA